MKTKIIISVLILLAAVALSAYFVSRIKTMEYSSRELGAGANGLVLFYGDGCPHCVKVDQFIADNNIKGQLVINKKEVFNNKENASILLGVNKKCGLSTKNLSVPMLWDSTAGKCFSGDVDIINYLQNKLNK